jgi:DHA1 family inner membrane transport protein
LAIAVNASSYQVAAAFAGWLGGRVIAGPGLPTFYLVAAATTVLGLALAGLALAREATYSELRQ